MRRAKFSIAFARLPLPSKWWLKFRENWLNIHMYPYRARLDFLVNKNASTFNHSLILIAVEEVTRLPIGALVLDIPRWQIPLHFRASWIAHVWTSPLYRRQGVATTLVKEAIRLSAESGAEIIRLSSGYEEPDNLYKRCGFIKNSEVKFLGTLKLNGKYPVLQKDKFEFVVGIDDLGSLAAIAAGLHYEVSIHKRNLSFGIDVEELLCTLLANDHSLGVVFFRKVLGDIVGCWALPENSDTLTMRVYTPYLLKDGLSGMKIQSLLTHAHQILNQLLSNADFPGYLVPRRPDE